MIRHLDQRQGEGDEGGGRLVAHPAVDRFKSADFWIKKVIRCQILGIASDLCNASIVLECLDQQHLYQHWDAVGPERSCLVVELCAATDQCNTISVQTFRCRRHVDDELPAQDMSVLWIACFKAFWAEAIDLRRWWARKHAAAHDWDSV
jgi:hypothetical protein